MLIAMIDFYDIELDFIPQGPRLWGRLPGHNSEAPPVNRQQVKLSHPQWMAVQGALMFRKSIRLRVCPQKVLRRWNTCGSSDLRQVVMETAPAVLRRMGVTVTPQILKQLEAGNYRVCEVHIAHQFWLRNRDIQDFLQRLRRTLNESHDPQGLQRGCGFRLNALSRTSQWLFYDKQREVEASAVRKYAKRFAATAPGSFARLAVAADREFQRLVASCGPRLELRLRDHFFRSNAELASGSGWAPDTADSLYQRYLEKLRLPHQVDATYCRSVARQRLARQMFRSYLLWAHGEPLRDVAVTGTDQTFQSHRRAIKRELGLDVAVPASAVFKRRLTVDAARVFRWDNRVQIAVDSQELC